ncbi:MAG: manganese efflux pump [Candidatus Coprenecus sp.]|nr:manganese efflux pump [Candidatus Coprenecus sp.]
MSYPELLLLAISLCFDTFTVSLSTSICYAKPIPFVRTLRIILAFAFGQAGFTLAGWLLGTGLYEIISSLDHWVAFIMLAYIGGKMLKESFHPLDTNDKSGDYSVIFSSKSLFLMTVATSIDAFAVGISIALLGMDTSHLIFCFSSIFLITAAASLIGLKSGLKLGLNIGKRAGAVGGVILILIGIKILVEHMIC